MIATVTLNPSIDHHVVIAKLVKDDAIRAQETWRDAGGKGINVSRAIKGPSSFSAPPVRRFRHSRASLFD